MEWVKCDFCGSEESRTKYVISTARYHREYINAVSLIGPNPPETFSIATCGNCGLMYVNPRYVGDELKAVYPEEQYTSRLGLFTSKVLFRASGAIPTISYRGEVVHSSENTDRAERIMRWKKGGRILDVGCNSGSFLALLEGKDWETYGVDFSEKAIENARNVFGQQRTFCGDLHSAAFPDCHFDVVTVFNTIEHLPNPRAVLEEIFRISKPDALLVIQTIDFDTLNARLVPRSLLYPGQHLYCFRKRDLVRFLRPRGWELADEYIESIGVARFLYYTVMHWITDVMVCLHRDDRSRWAEFARKFLERSRIIFDEAEMLRRLKLVGASNIPAFRAVKVFYFAPNGCSQNEEKG